MKNLLKFTAFVLIGCCLIVPRAYAQVKDRTILYAKCAYYEGPAEKKSPQGAGKLIINGGETSQITVTGTFEDTLIPDAVVNFSAQGVTFKGKVFYEKKREMLLLVPVPILVLQLSDGGFYRNRELLGTIGSKPLTIRLDCSLGIASFEEVSGEFLRIGDSYNAVIEQARTFADCEDYSLENAPVVPFKLSSKSMTMDAPTQSEAVTLAFTNGAKVTISDPKTGSGDWTRPNGDYLKVDNKGALAGYRLTLENASLADTLVTYKFDNGNQYVGSVCDGLIPKDYRKLVKIKKLEWPWSEFCKYSWYGTLTYPDGSGYSGKFSEKGFNGSDKLDNSAYEKGEMFDANGTKTPMIEGLNQQEYAKREAERKAQYEKEKASDYYKFDEQGNLKSFHLTYPDLAKHEYLKEGDKVVRNIITYADGTVVDMPWIVDNATYKELRTRQTSPDYIYTNTRGKRIFTDGLTISLQNGYIGRTGFLRSNLTGDWVVEEPKKENGDYAVLVGAYRYEPNIPEDIRVESMQKTFPDYTIFYDKDQRLEYPNGNVYRGEYELVTEGPSPLMEDPRIKALRVVVNSSYDNVVGARITNGVVCDPNGKVIEIYREGNKLDDFDFERERIQMQNRLDAERKRIEAEKAKKAAEEKLAQEVIQKYGEANVRSAAAGEIKIGMHEDLLKIAVTARRWKMDLQSASGNGKLYRIHGMTLNDYGSSASLRDGTIAHVYVSGHKVTNIEWYGNVRTY